MAENVAWTLDTFVHLDEINKIFYQSFVVIVDAQYSYIKPASISGEIYMDFTSLFW